MRIEPFESDRFDPPQDETVLWIHYFANTVEAAFDQHALRGLVVHQRMGDHKPDLAAVDRVTHQGIRGLRRVALSLLVRRDTVSDLNDSVEARRSFETARADDVTC